MEHGRPVRARECKRGDGHTKGAIYHTSHYMSICLVIRFFSSVTVRGRNFAACQQLRKELSPEVAQKNFLARTSLVLSGEAVAAQWGRRASILGFPRGARKPARTKHRHAASRQATRWLAATSGGRESIAVGRHHDGEPLPQSTPRPLHSRNRDRNMPGRRFPHRN